MLRARAGSFCRKHPRTSPGRNHASNDASNGSPLLARLLAVAVAVGIAASLSGVPVREAQAGPTRKITVFLMAGDQLKLDWEQRQIARFEQLHPDIDVEVITDAGSDYYSKLTSLWVAGTPPDVWDEGGAVRSYERLGWLLDLSPYIERDKAELDIEDFFPAAWNAYRDGKKQWGIPFMSVGSWLFYNADLIESAGLKLPPLSWDDTSWTWERMTEMARKMTRWSGSRMTRAGVSVLNWLYLDIAYPWMFGGDWFDEEGYLTGHPTRVTFSRTENIRAYQSAVDLMYRDKVAWPLSVAPGASAAFLNGQVGMLLGDGPWSVLGQTNKRRFGWGMAAVPRGQSGVKPADIVFTDPWMVSSQTRDPEAAWAFVKFITGKDAMKSYASIAQFPPARRSAVLDYVKRVADLSGHMRAQDVLVALEGAQRYGRESVDHVIDSWIDIKDVLGPTIGAMWTGQKPVEQVMNELDDKLGALLRNR